MRNIGKNAPIMLNKRSSRISRVSVSFLQQPQALSWRAPRGFFFLLFFSFLCQTLSDVFNVCLYVRLFLCVSLFVCVCKHLCWHVDFELLVCCVNYSIGMTPSYRNSWCLYRVTRYIALVSRR